MSLSIIEELEFDCLPREGEMVVIWSDFDNQVVALGRDVGAAQERTAPWSSLRAPARGKHGVRPMPRSPLPGDIVVVEEATHA